MVVMVKMIIMIVIIIMIIIKGSSNPVATPWIILIAPGTKVTMISKHIVGSIPPSDIVFIVVL